MCFIYQNLCVAIAIRPLLFISVQVSIANFFRNFEKMSQSENSGDIKSSERF